MKVAVTAKGNTAESDIDLRFGRCPYFMIYDTESGNWHVLENLIVPAPEHGAGIQAAQRLCDESVNAVITGNCGPKAQAVLDKANINIYHRHDGSVAEALAELRTGSIEKGESKKCE